MTTESLCADLIASALAATDQVGTDQVGTALADIISVLDALRNTLSMPVQTRFEAPANAPAILEDVAATHRRAHRPGLLGKIDCDPELQAFILARIETQTFNQIADAIKEHFPPARQVGHTSVHRWWRLREAAGEPTPTARSDLENLHPHRTPAKPGSQ